MAALKPRGSFYRTRTAYSINRAIQPTVSKLVLDVPADKNQRRHKAVKTSSHRSLMQTDTVLDCIVGKLKQDYKDQDILVMITPASRHAKLFKLHVMQRHKQLHLGMITVTGGELAHLKFSKTLRNYCIVFANRYINFVENEKMQNLFNCWGRKCGSASKETVLAQEIALDFNKSNTSSAGDYFKREALKAAKFENSSIPTERDDDENTSFSLNDVHTLMETLNRTWQPSKGDIKRFFYMSEQLNFFLVVRPNFLWKTAQVVDVTGADGDNVLVETYLPGSSYVGCVTLKDDHLLQMLDSHPKLLLNIHVIEDVLEITPLPKKFVTALKNVLGFLRLELLYDVVGEFLFDCYKNFTYL